MNLRSGRRLDPSYFDQLRQVRQVVQEHLSEESNQVNQPAIVAPGGETARVTYTGEGSNDTVTSPPPSPAAPRPLSPPPAPVNRRPPAMNPLHVPRAHNTRVDFPRYNGRGDAIRFLKAFETAIRATQETDDASRLRLLPTCLIDSAFDWYINLTDEDRRTWESFRDEFIKYFQCDRITESPKFLLGRLKQEKHETVRDYSARTKSLISKCDTPPDDEYLITWYVGGLRREIRKELTKAHIRTTVTTLKDIIELAMSYEDNMSDLESHSDRDTSSTRRRRREEENKEALVRETRSNASDTSNLATKDELKEVVKQLAEQTQKLGAQWQQSVLQAIESKIRTIPQQLQEPAQQQGYPKRDKVWCPHCT